VTDSRYLERARRLAEEMEILSYSSRTKVIAAALEEVAREARREALAAAIVDACVGCAEGWPISDELVERHTSSSGRRILCYSSRLRALAAKETP